MAPKKITTEYIAQDFSKYPDGFTIDGEGYYLAVYKNEYAKLYSGYALIESDIDFCSLFVSGLDEIDNGSVVNIAFTYALIITYGKMFAQAERRGVRLENIHIKEKHMETHKRILALRNKYVGHSDGGGEVAMGFMGLYPNKKNMKIMKIMPPHVFKLGGISKTNRDDLKKYL